MHPLFSCCRHELVLTPVTYIEVTSISHPDLTEESVISPLKSNCLKDCSLSTVSPCLFFHRKHFVEDRPMQFQCRVGCFLVIFGPCIGYTDVLCLNLPGFFHNGLMLFRCFLWSQAQFYLLLYSFHASTFKFSIWCLHLCFRWQLFLSWFWINRLIMVKYQM